MRTLFDAPAEPITLRPYQQEAVAAVYDHLRSRDDNPVVVIPTGGGKTPVMAQLCRDAVTRWNGRVLILAHVKELLEQTARTLAGMAPDIDLGLYSAGLGSRDTDHPVIVAGIQSVYRRACEMDRFDLVVVDECFPAGTAISTPRGEVPIEKLYVGQPVHTALGVGTVEAISGRTTDQLIELEMADGQTIRCTPNHPFFTEDGWRQAEALEVGSCLFSYEDMQALRQGGPKTNGMLASERVARIAHIQCESPVPVFNLQVSGHPSYYAEGVLAHNCHMIPLEGDGTYRRFLADARVVNPDLRCVGLTATPFRMKAGMICDPDHFLNAICYEVGVKELITRGYLSPLKTRAGTRKADTGGLHVRGGEYVACEVEALMDDDDLVRAACAEIIEETADRRATLIFAASVDHARHVRRVLTDEHGVRCECIFGETPAAERDRLIAEFRDGRLPYLANVNVLTTGFDAPNVDCVAMLRPTMSPGRYAQMIGRGLRLAPGKDDCLVLDFAGNVVRHGPVDAIRIKDPDGSSGGEAPAKECPECRAVVHAAYARCPECGHEFPPPETSKHDARASGAPVLSGQVERTTHEVLETRYRVWTKRGAGPDHPKTMRVEYRIGLAEWVSEWICFEHTGWPRKKAESWWRRRSTAPVPLAAAEAVELAESGKLAPALAVAVKRTAGETYPEVDGYELDEPPDLLAGELPAFELADDEIPF